MYLGGFSFPSWFYLKAYQNKKNNVAKIYVYIVATRYTIVFYLTASTTPQSQSKLQAAFIQ